MARLTASFVLAVACMSAIISSTTVSLAQESPGTPIAPEEAGSGTLAEFAAEIRLGDDPMSAATGVAVGPDGAIYAVSALRNEIRVLGADGSPIATWDNSGTVPGEFAFSAESGALGDLAWGPDGNVYILDTFNGRILVVSPQGEFLRAWGEVGSGPGQMVEPGGLGIDQSGQVYVADTDNTRIQIFDDEGDIIGELTADAATGATFGEVGDVAVSAIGEVFVSDFEANLIFHFNADGDLIGTIGEPGDDPGQLLGPWGLATDAEGRLFVVEAGGNRVHVFCPDGTSLGTIGNVGVQPGQFITPHYVAIGPDGLVYVSDVGNRRIQVFRLLPSPGDAATPIPS